ncbi:MAG TPA: CPBP family intramembrane glutamic endopeptidase [Bacteroidota bacterium]|nr:CPBP family intramembrane glutamic endopeptidase [Bacteroidota bacterium]
MKSKLFLFLASIPVIAAAAALTNIAGIKTHYYVWELLVDGKTLLLIGAFVLFFRPKNWRNEGQKRGVFRWSILRNIGAFLIPALVAGGLAGAGILLKKVSYADPENATTMLLTLIFDIPAIFIFSVTTVFVEEYLFRGVIVTEFERNGAPSTGLFVSSLLWALYAIVDELPIDEFTWVKLSVLLLFYFSVGIACGSLYFSSRSVWISYAFRIGVLTITPSFLSGVTGATDAFFGTENFYFLGDGIIASALLVTIFTALFFATVVRRKQQAAIAYAVK